MSQFENIKAEAAVNQYTFYDNDNRPVIITDPQYVTIHMQVNGEGYIAVKHQGYAVRFDSGNDVWGRNLMAAAAFLGPRIAAEAEGSVL